MSWPDDARFSKTAKGVVEIRDRLQGIASRSRQVLILVNGRRSVAELAQLIPPADLLPQLQMLEAQAFITRVSADAVPDSRFGPATISGPPTMSGATTISGPTTQSGPPTITGSETRSGPATIGGATAVNDVNGGPTTLIRSLWSDTRLRVDEPLQDLRDHVAKQLLATIGPAGDLMAKRIAGCVSLQDLRDLMPTVASIVEAIRGPQAARDFVIRATKRP